MNICAKAKALGEQAVETIFEDTNVPNKKEVMLIITREQLNDICAFTAQLTMVHLIEEAKEAVKTARRKRG